MLKFEDLPYGNDGMPQGTWTVHHEHPGDMTILGVSFRNGVAKGVTGMKLRRMIAACGHALKRARREDEKCPDIGEARVAKPKPAAKVAPAVAAVSAEDEELLARALVMVDRELASETDDHVREIAKRESIPHATNVNVLRKALRRQFEGRVRATLSHSDPEERQELLEWVERMEEQGKEDAAAELEAANRAQAADDEQTDPGGVPAADTTQPMQFEEMDWKDIRTQAADLGLYKVGMSKSDVIKALQDRAAKDAEKAALEAGTGAEATPES